MQRRGRKGKRGGGGVIFSQNRAVRKEKKLTLQRRKGRGRKTGKQKKTEERGAKTE